MAFAYLIDPLVERMADWKIGGKFQLGRAGSASLAVVAPGIAEALIATAIGLLAAIPAAIFAQQFEVSNEPMTLDGIKLPTPPTIDGTIDPAEWSNAATASRARGLSSSASRPSAET